MRVWYQRMELITTFSIENGHKFNSKTMKILKSRQKNKKEKTSCTNDLNS